MKKKGPFYQKKKEKERTGIFKYLLSLWSTCYLTTVGCNFVPRPREFWENLDSKSPSQAPHPHTRADTYIVSDEN